MSDENTVRWISGFSRRIGAFLIDSIILLAIGSLLSIVFEDQYEAISSWDQLFGFAMALTYFGVMNSKITGGQTIGKKVLKIRVVNTENQPIDVVRSFFRYSILGIPFFLDVPNFTNEAVPSYWIYPISCVVYGVTFSIVYLYIFNEVTRQSLHDLVVGTYVVNANSEKQNIESIWKPHLLVVSVIFIIAAIVPASTFSLSQSNPFKELSATQTALENHPLVSHSTFTVVPYGSSSVSSQIFLKENRIHDVGLARELARIIVINYPESKNKDVIQIILSYGSRISHTHSFNPNELQNIGAVYL